MKRIGTVSRKTNETDVHVTVNLDGTGIGSIGTGIGFFDHMLTHVSKHGLLDLDVAAKGDLHVDFHHTVEDVGLAVGEALRIGSRRQDGHPPIRVCRGAHGRGLGIGHAGSFGSSVSGLYQSPV